VSVNQIWLSKMNMMSKSSKNWLLKNDGCFYCKVKLKVRIPWTLTATPDNSVGLNCH